MLSDYIVVPVFSTAVTLGYLPALAFGMYTADVLRRSADPDKPAANPRPQEGDPLVAPAK